MTDAPWLPAQLVTAQLGGGITPEDVEPDRLAVAAWVAGERPDLPWSDYTAPDVAEPVSPPADVLRGVLLLAARLYARRSSPTGVVTGYEGAVAELLRQDPDVERMVGIGRARKPTPGGFG